MTDATNHGERGSALVHDWTYYAHLSIYHLALGYIAGKRVLDAGSGTGYGTAYLSQHGSALSVDGCDGSEEAVAFSNAQFGNERLRYTAVDLCGKLPFPDHSIDVIFTSNVMEHLHGVDIFLNECRRILAPQGKMIIAVPPIFSPAMLEANMKNEFHIMNLTPKGWHAKIGRFFENVRPHLHQPSGRFESSEAFGPEITKSASDILIREADFAFPETTIDHLNTEAHNMTAIFLVSHPRETPLPRSLDENIPDEWNYGGVISKVIVEEREHFMKSIALLNEHIANLEKVQKRGPSERNFWNAIKSLTRPAGWSVDRPASH